MTHETQKPVHQAVLVGIQLPEVSDVDNAASLLELRNLVKTLGFEVVGSLTQRRPGVSSPTLLGEGKLKELGTWTGGPGVLERRTFAKKTKAALKRETPEAKDDEAPTGEGQADTVVFDCELSPLQLVNLERATGAEVLDRTGVIVEIFSRHAHTREARLQVEIARLKYLAPRLRAVAPRVADRMGRAGESNVELDRRRIRDRLAELREELAAIQKEQAAGRSQRSAEKSVALVGYTNAGKSSLMRALTGSEVLVADKLFATLDTTVRRLSPPTVPIVLVSDTVGFIKRLPHDLVASFRSTLEEAGSADLLLHVVDASDTSFPSQMKVTHEVLASLRVDVPSLLVFNKCDKLTDLAPLRTEFPDAIFISTRNPIDVQSLRDKLMQHFEQGTVEQRIFVPHAQQRAISQFRSIAKILNEEFTDTGTWLSVRGEPSDLARVAKQHDLG